jgi:hypothetical protein
MQNQVNMFSKTLSGFVLPVCLLLLPFFMRAGNIVLKPGTDRVIFSSVPFQSLDLTLELSNLSFLQVQTRQGLFTGISAGNFGFSNTEGDPKLPVYHRLIQVPLNAGYDVSVTYSHYREIRLDSLGIHTEVLPAQAPVPKNTSNQENLPFLKNEGAYLQNQFPDLPLVNVTNVGTMRSVVMARIDISPVLYNPVSGIIRVYDRIEARIVFTHPDLNATMRLLSEYSSPYCIASCSILPNYRGTPDSLEPSLPETYVIVSHPRFKNILKRFIAWKTRKGFRVIIVFTGDPGVGLTPVSIKACLQGLYDNPPPGYKPPSFVLFAGDVDLVPTWDINAHPSDMFYCDYTDDHIPDVLYGRFAAGNTDQMNAILDKTLEYEQYAMPDDRFLGEAVMVAGADEINGPLYADGQINYGTAYYFNPAHDLFSHTYLQPEPAGNEYASEIRNEISNGVAFANYTAHGNEAGWADPSFTIEDIPFLQNEHKYCLMVGNCCRTADFSISCFAKEITSVANKGALGYIGCSDDSFWDEDYWWACGFKPVLAQGPLYDSAHLGAYDRTFHDHGEPLRDFFITMGQMVQGGDLAVEESGSTLKSYYWETYCLLGDPSLSVYYSVPQAIRASFRHELPVSSSSLEVRTEPMAYVALSLDDSTLLGSVCVDSSGLAVLNFPAVNHSCYARLIISRQNRRPLTDSVRFIPQTWPEGTGETSYAGSISIYPNPFNEQLNIIANINKPVKIRIILYDTFGRVACNTSEYDALKAGQQSISISTASLGQGVYFCRIETGSLSETRKVILMR